MKTLRINRIRNINDGTIGVFELEDNGLKLLDGYTLEPAGDDCEEANQDKRIPQGEYMAEFFRSPRFNRRLPLLYNAKVNKDRRILIHNGNFPQDTLGCILVGDRSDEKGVYNSVKTLSRLLDYLNYDNFKVIIKNKF
ncbi:MAG: DUF5675 family protein [Campylobacter curvus]